MTQKPNRLIDEKSPYLRQCAYEPVNWYPWGEEAFNKAKTEDKPIFLSIGYSTCHYCHRMSKESFMDEEVAKLLNESFVSIKVDREERPDIDQIYLEMAQIMTGQVGWPLTVIMTPDQVPFFATTYIPKEGNQKGFGLLEILTIFHTKWCVKRDELMVSVSRVQEYFRIRANQNHAHIIDSELLKQAYRSLRESFDETYGGFGDKVKFPLPHYISFLIRYGIFMNEPEAFKLMDKTLKGMVKGGIYDHLGGGFSRYAVDRDWLVPHFEKMGEDNALLVMIYLEAYRLTNNPLYAAIAHDTIHFIKRDLLSREGAFYTAIDADSEGIEGKYYLWEKEELQEILSERDYQTIIEYYNLSQKPLEHGYILNRLHISDSELTADSDSIRQIKEKLLQERMKRLHPHIDKKILTKNNAMMISSFIRYYMTFDQEAYLQIAERTAQFVLDHLVDQNGRLYTRYIEGERKYFAYADDYAYLIWAFIELFLATGKLNYLDVAMHFTQDMFTHYYDDKQGNFFYTANDSETLLFRNKEIFDGATPSANAMMAMNLFRIAEIFDDPTYEEKALRLLQSFGKQMIDHPTSHIYAWTAYLYYKIPKRKIVVVTDKITEQTKTLQQTIWKKCVPCTQMVTLLKSDIQHSQYFADYLDDTHPIALHICENYQCNEPIHDFNEMVNTLENLYLFKLKDD